MALGGDGGLMTIVAVDTGAVIRTLPVRDWFGTDLRPEQMTVFGLALSGSGRWLAGVVAGLHLVLVDLEGAGPIRSVAVDDPVRLSSIEFSPDGRFLAARASSFAPPKLISVGRGPRGQASSSATVDNGCNNGAMFALGGLIGVLACNAIADARASSNESSKRPAGNRTDYADYRRSNDAGEATQELAGMAGALVLWRLGAPAPVVVKSFGRTFEHLTWSPDSTKVVILSKGAQDGQLVKRLQVYARSEITERTSALPPPVESLTLGRSEELLFGVVATAAATMYLERRDADTKVGATTVQSWAIPSLLPPEDEADEE